MDREYRIAEYSGKFLAERLSSPGVWDVLAECGSKEEAEKIIKQDIRNIDD